MNARSICAYSRQVLISFLRYYHESVNGMLENQGYFVFAVSLPVLRIFFIRSCFQLIDYALL